MQEQHPTEINCTEPHHRRDERCSQKYRRDEIYEENQSRYYHHRQQSNETMLGIIILCSMIVLLVGLVVLFKCYKRKKREDKNDNFPRRLRKSAQEMSQYYEFQLDDISSKNKNTSSYQPPNRNCFEDNSPYRFPLNFENKKPIKERQIQL